MGGCQAASRPPCRGSLAKSWGRSLVACGREPGQEHLRIAPAHRPGDPPDAARPGRRLHSSRSGRRPGPEPRGAPDCPQPVRHQPAGSAHTGRLGSRCRAGGCAPQCRARAARALPEKDWLHALEHRTDPALRHGLGADPTPDRRAPGMGSQRDRRRLGTCARCGTGPAPDRRGHSSGLAVPGHLPGPHGILGQGGAAGCRSR